MHYKRNIRTVCKSLSLLTAQLLLTVVFRHWISVLKWLSLFEFELGYWKVEWNICIWPNTKNQYSVRLY